MAEDTPEVRIAQEAEVKAKNEVAAKYPTVESNAKADLAAEAYRFESKAKVAGEIAKVEEEKKTDKKCHRSGYTWNSSNQEHKHR